MKVGQIVLRALSQVDGRDKIRPVLLLRELPPFQDYLACGISTQLHLRVSGFDELMDLNHPDFKASGLLKPSIIRLGFLGVVPENQIGGVIGSVSDKTFIDLITRLSDFILKGRINN